MKVIIDGNEVECLNDVKVIYEGHGEDETDQLHLTLTYEGLVVDEFDKDGEIQYTNSIEATEIVPLIY